MNAKQIKNRDGLVILQNVEYILSTGEKVTVVDADTDDEGTLKIGVRMPNGDLESRFTFDFWKRA